MKHKKILINFPSFRVMEVDHWYVRMAATTNWQALYHGDSAVDAGMCLEFMWRSLLLLAGLTRLSVLTICRDFFINISFYHSATWRVVITSHCTSKGKFWFCDSNFWLLLKKCCTFDTMDKPKIINFLHCRHPESI